MTGKRRIRGFTLVEVLVALGIVAIALTAGLRATAALTNNGMRQSDILLAHICAENELVKATLMYLEDPDAPEGVAFIRWLAVQDFIGEKIKWSEMI